MTTIKSIKTETASLTAANMGDTYVVTAFLLNERGEADTSALGELAEGQFLTIREAFAFFMATLADIQTREGLGELQNLRAVRKLADYARRDATGLVP